MTGHENLHYWERHVAFIDLLGFADRVLAGENDWESFRRLAAALWSIVPQEQVLGRGRPQGGERFWFSE